MHMPSNFQFGMDGNFQFRGIRKTSGGPTETSSSTHAASISEVAQHSAGDNDALSRIRKKHSAPKEHRRRLKRERSKQKQEELIARDRTLYPEPVQGDLSTLTHTATPSASNSQGIARRVRSMLRMDSSARRDVGKTNPHKERVWTSKTDSGFAVRHADLGTIQEPKPRRPGQVKKIVNMYKDKTTSMRSLGRGGSSGCHRSC
ncbi:uncharacterized protein B0I36DRAFT_362532 [Microdochium trichocladiopsis]|uniref:Uncharacterized protein n=1 Tax=Microdochium trichocladiopsis TaxID=1682393 RepID=A0A9P9BMY7_9PEZI|nr:uncharacterized protein B0I36DRAFT_362532 [Microdochium trichocladiopsis]KAH7030706.1 hypothetical protein B0I36DRAFT_362532 [Microdochium trichocladiopsis]